MVQDRATVTMADQVVYSLLNRIIFNDLEQPQSMADLYHTWRDD